MGGIEQEIFTGGRCGPGAYNAAGKIIFGQQRKSAGVIDMRMGKYHVGQYPGIKRYDGVLFPRFFTTSLKHAAIQQNAIMFSG